MIKKNWKILLMTSVITLLPVLAGLIFWDSLPDRMPTHWNSAGEIDGWSSKAFTVFGLPLILAAVQWICLLATSVDPKKENHSEKVLHLIFWIVPALSVLLNTVTYAAALGKEIRMNLIMPVFIGFLIAVIGNYLPKCRHNYTIGIKVPWTLNSEENWNRTHRFAGRIWLICGIAMMLAGFFEIIWILIVLMLLMVLIPVIYSYVLYRSGI